MKASAFRRYIFCQAGYLERQILPKAMTAKQPAGELCREPFEIEVEYYHFTTKTAYVKMRLRERQFGHSPRPCA